ncbi:MAG: hypothetical protein INF92_13790 [Rhodobacter sp.]|nr:hypothetical protein [Rhodobacter sp.]
MALLQEAEKRQANARERAAYYNNEATIHGSAVNAYRAALSAFEAEEVESAAQTQPQPQPQSQRPVPATGKSVKGPSDLIPGGPKWAKIFARVAQDAQLPYSYADLEKAALDCGHHVTLGAMRAQMMNAVNAGLFEREGAGKFVMTDMGLEVITAPPENAASVGVAEANAEEAGGFSGVQNPQPSPQQA